MDRVKSLVNYYLIYYQNKNEFVPRTITSVFYDGYLTIEQVFSKTRMDNDIEEAHQWQEEFLEKMSKII